MDLSMNEVNSKEFGTYDDARRVFLEERGIQIKSYGGLKSKLKAYGVEVSTDLVHGRRIVRIGDFRRKLREEIENKNAFKTVGIS